MNTILKFSVCAALLGCAAWSEAGTARMPTLVNDFSKLAGPVAVNPQPLPPLTPRRDGSTRQGQEMNLASDTDIRHCQLECSAGDGCHYVCYHLTY